ncbi:MAG: 6-O-methylguanine DNA methyltransferase [Curvibacter sp. GWA2_64_110]|nr:MAG: 6-O-methylguanine DNA methyltransferase [Curvibacter sp. GWA2_64_110]HCY16187.1 6-O-methylguanine DNA methyltransferase [Curvibacter sp.]
MAELPLESPARQYAVVARAIDFLRANAVRQPALAEVAAAVHMSEFHLQRVFAAWAGISPKRFLQYLTKEHARQALLASHDLLSVTAASGLSSASRLHDLMVTCEAMTPGEIKRGGAGVALGFGCAATPFGEALVGWTARGLCYLAFLDGDDARRMAELASQWPAAQRERDDARAQQWLDQVFAVTPQRGTLHLVLRGTNFQLKVWEALLKVEPSRVVSYTQLARMAGAPKAQRAVGSALAANTIGYLIPCHRVIRESGDFGHYRWGSERKAAMLAWEAGHGARP